MFFKTLRRQQAGQPIIARTINAIADTAEWASRLRVSAPLNMKHSPAGPLIGITPYKGLLAVANGNIPPRSGSAAGVGSVFIVTQECTFSAGAMTGCTLTTSTISLQVYNPSSTTMTSGHGRG